MNRFFQVLLVGSLIGFSWMAMMIVHEIGHAFHALVSGGRVVQVVLSPWEFTRTDVSPNPYPLFVAWGGAVWGVLLPIAVWVITKAVVRPHAYLAAFFAGFCCIANGAYIGAGSIVQAGDAADMLRHGATPWVLVAYGILSFAAGLYLWNGLGPHFGLGASGGPVDKRTANVMAIALVVVFVGEVVWSIFQPIGGS